MFPSLKNSSNAVGTKQENVGVGSANLDSIHSSEAEFLSHRRTGSLTMLEDFPIHSYCTRQRWVETSSTLRYAI